MPNIDAVTGGDATEADAVYQAVVARIMIVLGEYPGAPMFGTRLALPVDRGFITSTEAIRTQIILSLQEDAEWYTINSVQVLHTPGAQGIDTVVEVVDIENTLIPVEVAVR